MELLPQIDKAFTQAQGQVEQSILKWLQRFADNNKVSMVEARKMLNARELKELRWSVEEYIKHGEENALNGQWVKQLENASARAHISRFEALTLEIQNAAEVVYGNHLDMVDEAARTAYTEGYYQSIFEVHKGIGVATTFAAVDDKMLSKVVNKPWAPDGQNFSQRIWKNRTQLVNELHNELTRMCLTGEGPDRAIKNIANRFQVSRNNAANLIQTESAFAASAAKRDVFDELDIEEYKICATLDNRTSAICQEMDGKNFSVKDFAEGVTAPPFHPRCRTTTAPKVDDEWMEGATRIARGEDGKNYSVPADMKYKDWKDSFVDNGSKDGLKPVNPGDTMEPKKEVIQDLMKLKKSGMTEDEYGEYLSIINNHDNPSVRQLYSKYGDEIKGVKLTSSKGAAYSPSSNSLTFNFDKSFKYPDMNKYDTLAHEYGHFFDAEVSFDGMHFKEMEAVRKVTGLDVVFKNVASSSDEFLEAIRKDKEHIRSLLTPDIKTEMIAHNASHGVQDAIDGLFPKSRVVWGHGERYYNRKYADIEFMDKMAKTSRKKALQEVYKDLGFDASNQAKVKTICRQYEAASEAWANIMSAEVCGGESLEYVKKYLPNSYQVMIEILKGVKK